MADDKKSTTDEVGCAAFLVLALIVGAIGSAIGSIHDRLASLIGPTAATWGMWLGVILGFLCLIFWINRAAERNRPMARLKYAFLSMFGSEEANGRIAMMNLSATLRDDYERFRGAQRLRRTAKSVRDFLESVHGVSIGQDWPTTGTFSKRQLVGIFEEIARILVADGHVDPRDWV